MATHILPLGIKNRMKTELPALIALEAIGQTWFSESHRFDLQSIALVSQQMSPQGSEIHLASSELALWLSENPLDVDKLRPLVVRINTWLQKQPNCRVQAAIAKLLKNCAPKDFPRKKFA